MSFEQKGKVVSSEKNTKKQVSKEAKQANMRKKEMGY